MGGIFQLSEKTWLSGALLRRLVQSPGIVALCITLIYSIRFLNCLPFSDFARIFNYETANTLTSYFIYAREPFSYPLGAIKGLTFPFADANIGNVGALPLFAVFFKALGKAFPYFQTFDYFVLVELISSFFTAFFAQKVLAGLGVDRLIFRALGALLTATAFVLMTRSGWLQVFCVVAFPLFMAWIYAMMLTLRRGTWNPWQDMLILVLFPIAALLDNYSLFALLLGTAVLLMRELFEAFFGGLPSSWNRFSRLLFFCVFGSVFSILALYVIGMFPLPAVPATFTSYDFGLGGRYHVADLFSPWIPVDNKTVPFPEPSLLGRLGFPFTTDKLAPGQYEGVAYMGTPVLMLWLFLVLSWLASLRLKISSIAGRSFRALILYSPWKKIGLAAIAVFIFSLGYELMIFGEAFPNFSGMPAAWIADRFPSVYNLRATGRLAIMLTIVLILEGVRLLYTWEERQVRRSSRLVYLGVVVTAILAVTHLIEIAPFLRPIPAQPTHPVGGVFTKIEIGKLHEVASQHDIVLIAPSVRAVDAKWTIEAFSLAYYLELRSNLYYLARTEPDHDARIARDLGRVMAGDWDSLSEEYRKRIIFAMPTAQSVGLRAQMRDRYQEVQVGAVSLWSRRHTDIQSARQPEGGKK